MYTLLITIVIGLFVAMLFVNLYFRAKVFKVYGILVRNTKAQIRRCNHMLDANAEQQTRTYARDN